LWPRSQLYRDSRQRNEVLILNNILQAAFCMKVFCKAFMCLQIGLVFFDIRKLMKKLLIKFWGNLPTGHNFIKVFLRMFFVHKFVQSQNITRKKAFVWKRRAKNVDKIDTRSQFQHYYTSSFFMKVFFAAFLCAHSLCL